MKKFLLIAISCLFLSSCLGVLRGVSTIGSVVSFSNDRRSAGTIVDDRTSYFALINWADSDEKLKDAHLNFMIYGKTALVVGEAPNSALIQYISKQAKIRVTKIEKVVNEVVTGPVNGILQRAKDTAITAQVDLLFYDQEVFNPAHVIVMTENQVVYLMGAVTKREAIQAARSATRASGVRKVVKVFKYLKSRPAAEIESDRIQQEKKRKAAVKAQEKAKLEAQKERIQQQINKLGRKKK